MHSGSLADEVGSETGIVISAVLAERNQDGGVGEGLFVLRTYINDIFTTECHGFVNCLSNKGGENISEKRQAQFEGEDRDRDKLAVKPEVNPHLGRVAHSFIFFH